MNTINWGIIGCGDVAEVKSGPAFQKSKHSSLLAVMRRDIEKAKDFAERHHVPLHYDNASALLEHQEINAVYIATPPSTHLHYALEAIAAKKNIYLEKPMTLNAEEAEVLSSRLNNSESKLTVAHYRRQLPAFLKVDELLKLNRIGEVLCVDLQILQSKAADIVAKTEYNWRLDASISGGGYFHDLAPHQLDLMLHWFGAVNNASGFNSKDHKNSQVATTVNGIIHFKKGVQFKGLWCFNVDKANTKDECIIYGTKGSITFPFFAGAEVLLNANGVLEVFKFENPKHIQQPMIQSTVNYFLGKESNPCAVDEGLAVMAIIDKFSK